MKLRVAQYYNNGEIRLGKAFELTWLDDAIDSIRSVYAIQGITQQNYKEYFEQIRLVHADSLKPLIDIFCKVKSEEPEAIQP